MSKEPIYHTLQEVQHAIDNGEPLQPLGAAIDPTGTILTVQTDSGPAAMRLGGLKSALACMAERMARHQAKLKPVPPKKATSQGAGVQQLLDL